MPSQFEQKDAPRFKALIRDELAELERLAEGTASDRAPVQLDQQSVGRLSRMDAMQGQALAQASGQRRQARDTAGISPVLMESIMASSTGSYRPRPHIRPWHFLPTTLQTRARCGQRRWRHATL